jgi:PKD repeat protein
MIAAVDGGPYPPPSGYGGSLSFTLDNTGPPQANFSYTLEQWYGLYAYYFSNQSYDPAGAGMTAYWDFGDGTTSTDWSLHHQFPSEGVYQVTLTVTTFDGRSASTQQEVTVTPPPPAPPPMADFFYYPSDVYTNTQVQFYNSSWDPGNFGMYANWDFGDGTTSNDWSPSHKFITVGTYTVTLTVTTYDGRSASTMRVLTVAPPPPPVAEFNPNPFNPSTYDTVQFDNLSYDPACWYCYSLSASWDFGDGAMSTQWGPTHRYAADGNYTVTLTITTPDGRVGSTTRSVPVWTHEVAITKFTVPQSAKAGQTRSVTVEVNNTRYPEQVQVDLYKSTVNGWQWVGSLQQSVPVRPANRTTGFVFSYTFTPADAQLGRINFRAVATIMGARDALPMNNEAISLPTKVMQ